MAMVVKRCLHFGSHAEKDSGFYKNTLYNVMLTVQRTSLGNNKSL